MSRVVLAMSGGVDSSVAAWLLREQGHDVVGLFMRHGQQPDESCPTDGLPFRKQGCCTAADAADARRVADMLDIPFYAVNFEQEFARIVDYFVAEYTAGRTPNPCIVCNTWLKFGRLFDYADSIGAEFVATGHYARLVSMPSVHSRLSLRESSATFAERKATIPAHQRPRQSKCGAEGKQECLPHEVALCRGLDETKDQSYVLFGIQRHLLPRLMFPVGEYRKEEIRRIAERLGLRVAGKRDSQEICFVPDQDHARFVRQHRPAIDTAGEIVTTDGTVVGRHDGFERFTVGQRKGLRVALGEPRYVVRVEPDTHRVVLGTQEELARRELDAAEANWLTEERGEGRGERGEGNDSDLLPSLAGPLPSPLSSLPSFRAQVKIRYRSRPTAATVELLPAGRFHVRFNEPCHAVAPGQAAVCYDGDRVLGGGWIE
jgi:tRNA-specific 2-thiouridylase